MNTVVFLQRCWAEQVTSIPHALALLHLRDNPNATPSDLARVVGFSSAAATGMLDTLESHEARHRANRPPLITRARHPDDRRVVLVNLTEAGLALVDGWRAVKA